MSLPDEQIFETLSLHRAGVAWRYALRVLQHVPRLLLATPIRALRAIADESTLLREQVIGGGGDEVPVCNFANSSTVAVRDGTNAML